MVMVESEVKQDGACQHFNKRPRENDHVITFKDMGLRNNAAELARKYSFPFFPRNGNEYLEISTVSSEI